MHLFSLKGINVAVDSESGSINLLDEVSYNILKAFPESFSLEEAVEKFEGKYSVDLIKEVYEEIKTLEKEGSIFSQELTSEGLGIKRDKDFAIKALCLNIAHDCDLACKYCFASKGSYKLKKSIMPVEVAFEAVDFMLENSGSRKNLEIDFFGGEPLLNYDLIVETVKYAREKEKDTGKRFNFTVTTNGTLLDSEKIDFINNNMDNVVISIDGRQKIHDNMRCFPSGEGSYDDIVPKAMELIKKREKGKSYFVRGTYTARNLDFSKDVLHIANLGAKEISIEPVVGKGESFHIKPENLPVIFLEYEKLLDEILKRNKQGNPFKFYHFNLNIYKGPCIHKRITACGAGSEYFAVSTDGDLYPCHQFVGQKEFIIGNVKKGLSNTELKRTFDNTNIFSKEACKKC